jgi:hypothetical protein
MSSLFKPVPILLKISTNRMEVLRLDNGRGVAREAPTAFSNARLVVAHFSDAEDHLKALLREVIGGGILSPKLHMVVQQTERAEGGLCSVEKRALVDLCEFCGASKVQAVEQEQEIGPTQALALLGY